MDSKNSAGLESPIQENALQDKPLTINEAATFLNLSPGYIYKLTHRRLLPYSKPFGKKIFFDRSELLALLKKKRVKTNEELNSIASAAVNGGSR